MAPPESEVGFFTYTAQAPETRIFSRYNAGRVRHRGFLRFAWVHPRAEGVPSHSVATQQPRHTKPRRPYLIIGNATQRCSRKGHNGI